MAHKNFRFHEGTNATDWATVTPYGATEIDKISDPTGGSARKQITSIPSPFARTDLFRTAFEYIANEKYSLDGDTIYHKLVSDCFDIGQLFFGKDGFQDRISVKIWNRSTGMAALTGSSNEKLRLYGETLNMFLSQDATAYNFDLMENVYLLECQHKIIGGTSPATLFFSSANDLSFVNIRIGNDIMLDNLYMPLYKREPLYQLFIYHFFKKYPHLSERMKDMTDYLNKSLKRLESFNPELYTAINQLKADDYDTTIDYTESYEILKGHYLRTKVEDPEAIGKRSDFAIRSTVYKGSPIPLVLQNGFSKSLKYDTDAWTPSIEVPYVDAEKDLSRRKLPALGTKYPYLTVSDFLEPFIIKTFYPLNKERYFDGNLKIEVGSKNVGYILPLKPLFFEFFSTNDLLNTRLHDGKPMIEMVQITGAVRVTLRIPIRREREYITFERLYYNSSEIEMPMADEANNKGYILENQFGINIFPFVKTNFPPSTEDQKEPEDFYRVQLVETDNRGVFSDNKYELNFFKNGKTKEVANKIRRDRSKKKPGDPYADANSQYYVLNNSFDYIQVKNNFTNGIILPKWQETNGGNEAFTFAIDFGTTYTHIECRKGHRGKSETFSFTDIENSQTGSLFDPKTPLSEGFAIELLANHEFLPPVIGEKFKFPQRTIVAERQDLENGSNAYGLADVNIPFIFEKEIIRNSKVFTNLKWAKKEVGNENRTTAFFEQLMMMLRTKVLMNNGDLKETKLVWFYPSSMKAARITDLTNAIEETFQRFFCSKKAILVLTESLAPFYYYRNVKDKYSGITASASDLPAVSIDIGGGTTDVVVFKAKKIEGEFDTTPMPHQSLSFKFAGNTLFGEGFARHSDANSNGFIEKYAPYFDTLLNNHTALKQVLNRILIDNPSEDVNNFLFSIEKNVSQEFSPKLSYNNLLAKDGDMKLLVLYFYTAIVYHVAKFMHNVGLERPGFVLFSGTASKLINIISVSSETVTEITEIIFKKVYGEIYQEGDSLKVIREKDFPKEVTCRGGIMVESSELRKFSGDTDDRLPKLPKAMKEISHVYTGIDDKSFEELFTYEMLNDEIYKQIEKEVRAFNAFFVELHTKDYNFNENFNINEEAVSVFKKHCNEQLKENLMNGLRVNSLLDEKPHKEQPLEETMFFYPIMGTINYLSTLLARLHPINQ
ncbi:MAG: virulence factor SrfB [Arcicella sp.]|jgi:hypothetical protein|nr:virulence factor SrfB [Arcicella sp.]